MRSHLLEQRYDLRRWEAALILGVLVAVLVCGWAARTQSALADKVIRLHVIANSDTPEDQALKLQVRDRILEEASLLFREGESLEQTALRLEASLEQLATAGQAVVEEAGYDYPVTASMEETYFPTKEYADFALPAGSYTALRVVIGEGAGQNWWCVVFPPLCLGSVVETADTAMAAGFTQEDVQLITGGSEEYVLKFRALELWGELQHWLETGREEGPAG